jgi:hypothetical protein
MHYSFFCLHYFTDYLARGEVSPHLKEQMHHLRNPGEFDR